MRATQQLLAEFANKVKHVAQATATAITSPKKEKFVVAYSAGGDGIGEDEGPGSQGCKSEEMAEETEEEEEDLIEVFEVNEDDLHKEHVKVGS